MKVKKTNRRMKAFVSTGRGRAKTKFNGTTLRMIAILRVLKKVNRAVKARDIAAGMVQQGVLPATKSEQAEVSAILRRLVKTRAVYHPSVSGGKHRYCLGRNVRIEIRL